MNTAGIERLYGELLTCWNRQDAKGMAALFCEDGNVVGFDGSQMNGKAQIEAELQQVFENHKTASYVWKIKEVRFLDSEIVLLRSIAGMVAPGKKEINPAVNVIQSLVVAKQKDNWKISLFQNTPAQFHGRPELVEQMTSELNQLI